VKKVTIHNSLEHILVYGYFQHAFEFYLAFLKPEGVSNVDVVEMQSVFRNIRSKIRNGTYLTPNILDSISKENLYPIKINFSEEELYWFNKIIKINFKKIISKTKQYYKRNKINPPTIFYFELYSNLRTDAAIEFLRKDFIQKLKKNS
jgi:hypothetical protein